ncbi:Uncharacterised protein [uncultured archaeon]|nr:Uncharacterised protein [uncultured archaeon]
MEKELVFEFRIQSITRDGKSSFHPAVFNQGVPNEIILSMMRAWLRGAETAYFEHFRKDFT